jgi:hypothetical protein
MRRSFASGSVSDAPTEHGPDQGIMVIDGLVRAGFVQPAADPGHQAMRVMFTVSGKVSRGCERPECERRR